MKKNVLGKVIAILSVFVIVLVGLTGCTNAKPLKESVGDKKVVYTSFFPIHDFTERIVGDKMDVRTIITGDEEPHDFELQSSDMANISKADLIIYNGANMEAFMPDLKNATNNDNKFLDLSTGISLLESSGNGLESSDHNHARVNPHTWLSVKNAETQLEMIYKKVSELDPENKDYYKANFDSALKEFQELDKEFETELSGVKSKEKYFVVSHAAFDYLARDYGLKQVVVTGISPEEEPSAKQLAEIVDFVKAHNIGTVFFEGKATPKVAETLAKNAGVKTATLYTMETPTDDEAKEGYVKLMRHNLQELVKALNE